MKFAEYISDVGRKKYPQYFGFKISWKETAVENETCLKQNVDKSGTYVGNNLSLRTE
jgi:hypothetical protein